jgi:uncharacterized protein with HEPN domain
MLESAEKIILYCSGLKDAMVFFNHNDQMTFNACLNLLAQIGEQAGKLSTTLTAKHTAPDWNKIKGMRNRIVHDYTGIDVFIVFDTVKNYIPELRNRLITITKAELHAGNFDKEELAIAATSPYLRHIDFTVFLK